MNTLKLGLLICLGLLCSMSTCNHNENNTCNQVLGDWKYRQGTRILKTRFDKDGTYAFIQDYTVKFGGEDTLDNGYNIYLRQSGTTGIVGAWKTIVEDTLWEMHYYNADKTYRYEWNNGDNGTGYYTFSGNQLRIVEYRSTYTCSADSIIMNSLVGDYVTRYHLTVEDTVMRLRSKDTVEVYTRL